MMPQLKLLLLIIILASCSSTEHQATTATYTEQHRPQIHFSPTQKWMNDPNGLVFYNDVYHLFYQYYPDSTVWGPMHWGHAVSKDLIHWQHLPIALYPDSLGYIFSGSAVVDMYNTSGFAKNGEKPLIAIYTNHNAVKEKAHKKNFQTQSIAYSLDEGKTWTKYSNNPVLKNPGIRDFRDPKVMWFEEGQKWIMTLATKDRITFYSSENLKDWTKESEFGDTVGAHGGVWECPDLFPIDVQGEKVWVLLVSINPGGPNEGSATQYFTGKFDGKTFTPFQTDTRWIDYGPDDYAGVTWSNTGERRIFLGWMSNWLYGTKVPTVKWRSAMTIPRDLSLEKIGDKYFISSRPVPELSVIEEQTITLRNIAALDDGLSKSLGKLTGPFRLSLESDKLESFTITFSNNANEKVLVGYDKAANSYFIDRTNSGKVSFAEGFPAKYTVPRLKDKQSLDMTLIIDNSSVELFADSGLSVMTAIFFPNTPFSNISIKADVNYEVDLLRYGKLKKIW